MRDFKLEPGMIFCTRNPMALGKAINFVQKIHAKDNQSEYSHSGIFLDDAGTTFEALWTNCRQDFFTAYKGKKVLIGRHASMTPELFQKGWEGIKHHEGKWYAGHRLFLFFVPFLAKHGLGLGVCSELTAKFLCKAGLLDYWKGLNPDDISDMIHRWKVFDIIFEGILKPD